jgi:hypothetical protein
MPIFGVTVYVPYDTIGAQDYNIWSPAIRSENSESQDLLLKAIDFFNNYLWWAFSVVCTAVVVYGWFRLITANWDKKALKQWIWALVWSAIGVAIAMISYMLINLLANLNF